MLGRILIVVALLSLSSCTSRKPPSSPAPPDSSAATGDAAAGDAVEQTDPLPPEEHGSVSAAPTGPRPLYYERTIEMDDLKGRTLRELAIMRNMIFARAGQSFRKRWLREYFSSYSWYKPKQKYDKKKLSELDWENLNMIGDEESFLMRDELEQRLATLQTQIGSSAPSPEQIIELKLLSSRLGRWVGPRTGVERSPLEDPAKLDRLLTLDQLDNLSLRDLRILRNTIYARRGYPFSSNILTIYFMPMSWYERDDAYTDKRLTRVDWKNIKLIKSVEKANGGPLSDNEHGDQIGWMGVA